MNTVDVKKIVELSIAEGNLIKSCIKTILTQASFGTKNVDKSLLKFVNKNCYKLRFALTKREFNFFLDELFGEYDYNPNFNEILEELIDIGSDKKFISYQKYNILLAKIQNLNWVDE